METLSVSLIYYSHIHIPTKTHTHLPTHTNLSLSRPPVSSSVKFCNRSFTYAAPALWNGLPEDLHQLAHPPNPPLNFPYPTLALSPAAFLSRLKTDHFKLSYPDSTPAPPHVGHPHRCQP